MFSSAYSECSVSKTCNWQFIRWKNKSHTSFFPTLKNDHVQPLKHTDLFNKVMNISLEAEAGNKTTLHMFSFSAAFLLMFCSLSKQRGSLSCSRNSVYSHSSSSGAYSHKELSKGRESDLAATHFEAWDMASSEQQWGGSRESRKERQWVVGHHEIFWKHHSVG